MKLKRKIVPRDWFNIIAIVLLVLLFVWVGRSYTRVFGTVDTGNLLASAENLRTFIFSYGSAGVLVVILIQVLQVVISVIPSVLVSFVGGMIYGMTLGMVTSTIGIFVGTCFSFYLTRFLGRRIVTLFVSEANLEKVEKLMSTNTSTLMLLILFILPTPKDFFAYFIGLTDMKASKFLLISTVGRIPGQIIATYLGAHILDRNYVLIGAVVVVCTIFTVLFFVFKDRIFALAGRITKK